MKFKRIVKESYTHPNAEAAVNYYRARAQLEEGVEVTPETINEAALTEAAIKNGVQKVDLRRMILGEQTLGGAAREVEQSKEIVRTKTEIEEALDDLLEESEETNANGGHGNYPTLLIEGEAGIGKTSVVRQWCSEHGFNFFEYDLRQASPESFEGIVDSDPEDPFFLTRRISKELLIPLSKPNTVMFLDEYNRARTDIRQKLLGLILNHEMNVPMPYNDFEKCKKFYAPYGELQSRGTLYFPNLLFVVCAQNPYSIRYSGTYELDTAESDRMVKITPEVNHQSVAEYFDRLFGGYIKTAEERGDTKGVIKNKNRLGMAKALLNDSEFFFDTPQERDKIYDEEGSSGKTLTPRSLEAVLRACDGTVAGLLKKWDSYCNRRKKSMVETILGKYTEVQDEANAALDGGSDSATFGTKRRPSAEILRRLSELD